MSDSYRSYKSYDFDVKFTCSWCHWQGTYGMMYGINCPVCKSTLSDKDIDSDYQSTLNDKDIDSNYQSQQIKERIKEVLLS